MRAIRLSSRAARADAIDPETMRAHAADATRLLKALGNEQRLMVLCLLVDGTVYILKIGFDEAFAAIAPGNLIMEQLFLQCAEDKQINKISFVTGKDWNYLWGAKSLRVYDHQIFNRTSLRGWSAYLLRRAKDVARSLAIAAGFKKSSTATT